MVASNSHSVHCNTANLALTSTVNIASSFAVAGTICILAMSDGTSSEPMDFTSFLGASLEGILGLLFGGAGGGKVSGGPTAADVRVAPQPRRPMASSRQLTIVIPCRTGSAPQATLASLSRQTFHDFDIVLSYDQGRGANWARNRGFRLVRTPLVLFSDDDIEWHPFALQGLKASLDTHPEASYSYGSYVIPGVGVRSNMLFDPARLRRANYISTMSMMRTADFPGFDESIQRFQDWDLWLTMLERGKKGVHCGRYIFHTRRRPGITYGGSVSADEATRVIKKKHRLQ